MDACDKVQEIRPAVEGEDENITSARQALLHEIRSGRKVRAPKGRRGWIIAAGLAGAAAVTVGVLMVGHLVTPAPTIEAVPTREPGSTAIPRPTLTPTPEPLTASAVLHGASYAATTVGGPVAGPGQYLRVQHSTEQLVLYADGSGFTPFDATRSNATAAWVASGSYVTYIPADRSGEWVRVFEPERPVTALYGADAQAHAAQWSQELLTDRIVLRSIDGIGDRYPGSTEPLDGSDAYYAQMPRDPSQLIEWFRAHNQKAEPGTEDLSVVMSIVEVLELNAAPADLRAALFLALDGMGGADIVSVDGTLVTIAFRYDVGGWVETVSIDSTTGMLVGSTRTFGSGSAVVPDDVPNFRLSNSISVVDSAP
ncbi:MAG: hypothetical protein J7484_04240 [Microbacterium sp.]|nr:hypothetical protein [Microbacterium sp.]